MSKNTFKPLSRKVDIVTQEAGKETLIYDLKINKAFILNETSSIIWLACDGRKTVSEISQQITKHFNSPINEEFVWFALEQLKKDNLIENKFSAPFEGLSRREIIRKVGFASIISLPLVASLVSPIAIHAASCAAANNNNNLAAPGCACVGANDCQNSCCGAAGSGRACVALQSVPAGGTCRANCECPTGFSCPAATRICQ